LRDRKLLQRDVADQLADGLDLLVDHRLLLRPIRDAHLGDPDVVVVVDRARGMGEQVAGLERRNAHEAARVALRLAPSTAGRQYAGREDDRQSLHARHAIHRWHARSSLLGLLADLADRALAALVRARAGAVERSEEHTSELQSRSDLVCRLLLEKKKKKQYTQKCTATA